MTFRTQRPTTDAVELADAQTTRELKSADAEPATITDKTSSGPVVDLDAEAAARAAADPGPGDGAVVGTVADASTPATLDDAPVVDARASAQAPTRESLTPLEKRVDDDVAEQRDRGTA